MFDDKKIDFIESLPERDSIIVCWMKLLTMAGKCNAQGFIFLTEKIPYNINMLVHALKRPMNTVLLALETLSNLDMIQFEDKKILKIINWEKHQNINGLERIKEQNRLRVAKHRSKNPPQIECNITGNVTVTDNVTLGNAIDKEKELEKDIKKKTYKRKSVTSTRTFVRPTLDDVIAYIKKRNSNVDAQRFFDYFEAGEWIDSKGEPVRNWKQKLITWEKKNGGYSNGNDSERIEKGYTGKATHDKYGNTIL